MQESNQSLEEQRDEVVTMLRELYSKRINQKPVKQVYGVYKIGGWFLLVFSTLLSILGLLFGGVSAFLLVFVFTGGPISLYLINLSNENYRQSQISDDAEIRVLEDKLALLEKEIVHRKT